MIEITNLTFKYGFGKEIYSSFNLKLEKGKIYGILGKNGCGKTTLLNILSTLLPGYNGSVCIDSIEAKERKSEYLQKIYFLPEIILDNRHSINDLMTNGSVYKSWNEEKFLQLTKRDGLDLKTKLKSLSKGQRKRAYFNQAIAANPEIMILDEVTEGVDILSQKDIIEDIKEYFSHEKTVLISSHHIEEFENIIDEFIIIDSGKLLKQCTREYIDTKFGWIPSIEANKIDVEDRKQTTKFITEEYILVENIEKYKFLKFNKIDLATFLRQIIGKEN